MRKMRVFALLSLLCGGVLCTKIQVPQEAPLLNRDALLRIVGGRTAFTHQFPYQAGLSVKFPTRKIFCGGSLISPNFVLSAAHCADGAISIDVVLGARNISDASEASRQTQTSRTFIVHPDWDENTFLNDISLIKLAKPAKLNGFVRTVRLARGSLNNYAGSQGIATGWGITADTQDAKTDILHYARNVILSNEQCKATGSDYASIIKDTHLCLSGEGSTSICEGDSGGPLISNGVQVGVTSFSYQSCEAAKPSVFTRVSSYYDWIVGTAHIICP